jgi:hypothetical protein
VAVRETVSAAKQRFGAKEVAGLFAGATKLVVAKGKQVLERDLKREPLGAEELAELVLGPTGNLRAPTVRVGTSWFVGFHPELYAETFG